MRRTKAELADEVIALRRRTIETERGGTDAELAEALMESEERLKTFIKHTPAPITLKGADGRYILVNTSFCERRGVTHEQVLGKTAYDVYPKAVAENIEARDREVFTTRSPLEFDFDSIAPDGSEHNYLAIRFPGFDTDGEVVAVGGVNLEITERRRAEEELRKLNEELEQRSEERTLELRTSEVLFRSFVDNSVAPITLKDLDGRFLLANKSFARNRGMEVEDIVGKTNRDLFSTEMAKTFEDHDRQVLVARKSLEFEVDSVDAEGIKHSYLMVRFPVTGTDGKVFGTGLVTTDITERKRTEEALRLSEQRHSMVTMAATEGLYDWDITKDTLYISERLNEIIGFEQGDLTSKDWNTRVHVDDAEIYRLALVRHFKQETDVLECEYRIRDKSGGGRWISDRAIAQMDDQGRAIRLVGAITDITERKQADQALRESEQRLQQVLRGGDLGFWDADFETGHTAVNERWAEILGYTIDEIENGRQVWRDTMHRDDRVRMLKTGRRYRDGEESTYEGEYRVITKQGETKWLLTKGSAVQRNENGKATRMAGTVMDITERKRAEEALR